MDQRLPRRIVMALRSLLWRGRVDRELDAELQFHLEQMQEHAVARGDEVSAARASARRYMGSMDQVKEACRDMRTLRPVEHFLQDLRFGARLLARSPGFTAVAVLSLALGIGAGSAIFSVINAIVLRPLPVAHAEELHIVQTTGRYRVGLIVPYQTVERAGTLLAGRAEIAAHSSIESALVAARGDRVPASPAESAWLQLVAADYFGTLRQRPQIGRLIGPADNRGIGQHPVAVISDGYWSRRFGRRPDILDMELIVNGAPLTIVGVAAPEFFGTTVGPRAPEVWAPAAMQHALRFHADFHRTGGDLQKPWASQPEIWWLQVMIRTPPAGVGAAAGAMTLALRGEPAPADGANTGRPPITLLPGSRGYSSIRSDLTRPLVALLLMVGLLLTIACANIAGLLSARATTRGREMAIRLSIGAGRGRVIRQLLTESLLLAMLGGMLGLAIAYWGSAALLTSLTRGATMTSIDVRPDWRVVALTFATSIVTAVIFGLLPAVRGTRVPLADSLKTQTRGVVGETGRGGRMQAGKLLITAQMAFAVLLLLVAALFARSLQALTQVDVGYDRAHVLAARIDPRASGYAVAELPALHARVLDRLARLPGVVAVSASANGPFSGSRSRGDFQVEGYTPRPGERVFKHTEWVTSDYFRTVGLTITRGRGFRPDDTGHSRRVSVINETMARHYYPNQDPIGRRWGNSDDFDADGFEIVGVVEDARINDVRAESLDMAFVPATQTDRYMRSLEVRAAGDPASLMNAVRTALRETEPRLAVGAIDTLDSRVTASIGVDRLLGWLTMTFGAAALGLACLGLYGTISYAVRQRTPELGIRIALGADRTTVQWLIVRDALVLVIAGGAIGLPLAFLAARAARGLFYETAPSDPLAYVVAAVVLVAVSACAAYVPARRASHLDPVAALRSD